MSWLSGKANDFARLVSVANASGLVNIGKEERVGDSVGAIVGHALWFDLDIS